MKQIVSVFVLAALCLSASRSFAQINQGFDPISSASPLPSLTANCWSFAGAGWANTSQITGTGFLYIIPTTSNSANLSSNNAKITTPFIDLQTGNIISLKYKLNNDLSTQAERVINFSLLDRDGVSTALTSITLTRNTASATTLNFSYTIAVLNPGTQRLVIDVSGSGDGNTYLYMDDLSLTKGTNPLATVNPAFHYAPTNCNGAPVAMNNTYNAPSNKIAYTAISVLNNDSDPNNESLTATLATPSPDGTVVMNSNGTFTFTPKAGFTGNFTSFTYTATDNGYSRIGSTATVYIYFPQFSALPIQLIRFSGTATAAKTALSWNVAANETGLLFEVQRSKNGSGFESIATFFTTETVGEEQYGFADAAPTGTVCYRLKIVNKDGTMFLSNTIAFKAAAANEKIILLQNPVQTNLRFSLPSGTTAIKSIHIYNTAGVVMYTEKTKGQKSNNSISLPLHGSLPAGTYILEIVTAMGSKTTTFIKA